MIFGYTWSFLLLIQGWQNESRTPGTNRFSQTIHARRRPNISFQHIRDYSSGYFFRGGNSCTPGFYLGLLDVSADYASGYAGSYVRILSLLSGKLHTDQRRRRASCPRCKYAAGTAQHRRNSVPAVCNRRLGSFLPGPNVRISHYDQTNGLAVLATRGIRSCLLSDGFFGHSPVRLCSCLESVVNHTVYCQCICSLSAFAAGLVFCLRGDSFRLPMVAYSRKCMHTPVNDDGPCSWPFLYELSKPT